MHVEIKTTPRQTIMATGSANSGSDVDRNKTLECDTCLQVDGLQVAAAGFCKTCFEYLCTDCIKQHCRPRQLRNHKVVGQDDMPKRRLSNRVFYRICGCGEKDVEIYCHVHRTLSCEKCFRQNHKSCDYRDLSEEPAGLDKSEGYLDFHKDLNNSEKMFEDEKLHANDYRKQYIESSEKASEKIGKIQNLLKQKLEHVNKIETEMKKMLEEYSFKMQLIENENKSAVNNIREYRDDLQTTERIDQAGKLFAALHQSGEALRELKDKMKTINEGNILRILEYTPSVILLNALMDETDKINEVIYPDGIQSTGKSSVPAYVEYGLPKCVKLSESCIAVIDKIYNNLQVVKAGQTLAHLELSSGPWDIATLSNTSVVITLPRQKKIVFVELENQALRIEKEISVNCKCEGIASAKDKLYIASSVPACIVIVDTRTSRVVRSIIKENIFEQPAYIDVHEQKGLICLSDRKAYKIFIMNERGEEVREFASENMKMPLSVAFRGEIVIAIGFESNTINKIFYEQGTENAVETKKLDDVAIDKVFRDPNFNIDPSWKFCASKYFMLVCKSSQ